MRMRLSLWIVGLAAALSAMGCITPREHNLPPADRLMEPGPGVGGPGPGVMTPAMPPMMPFAGGMPPRILSRLKQPDFLDAMRYKGRFRDWVARIPVHVVLDHEAPLHGAALTALALAGETA